MSNQAVLERPTAIKKRGRKRLNRPDPICRLRVKPNDNLRVLLGRFELGAKLKGFVVELSPDPEPLHAVDSRIERVSFDDNQKFFLDITNNSERLIIARVRPIL